MIGISILIFLIVTTPYSKFSGLQNTLPTADAEKAIEQPLEINVGVDAQGRYAIDNAQVGARDAAALAEELKNAANAKGQSRKDPVIIINADATAAHQSVINVLEAARLAGCEKCTFAAQASSGK